MHWLLALAAALLSALVLMPIHFGRWFAVSKPVEHAAKAAPTLMASAFAGWALFHQPSDPYALLMFAGVVVGAAADVMLGIHFVTGGFLFLLGHILYLSAFCLLHSPTLWSLPVFVLVFAGLWVFCQRYRPLMKNAVVRNGLPFYCAALSAIIALSLPTAFLIPSQRTILAAIGAICFALSDMGVFHGIVMPTDFSFNYRMLGLYYFAQLLLGMSALHG